MFTIRAAYSDRVEIKTGLRRANEFFTDIKNFVELMPGVESIHTDGKAATHWKIRARDSFYRRNAAEFYGRAFGKKRRAYRMVARRRRETKSSALRGGFRRKECESDRRAVFANGRDAAQFRQRFALARGTGGESIISGEMSKRVAEMIKTFVRRARERLEEAS
jgi:carbon monoxide dehydrogenase subunit G